MCEFEFPPPLIDGMELFECLLNEDELKFVGVFEFVPLVGIMSMGIGVKLVASE